MSKLIVALRLSKELVDGYRLLASARKIRYTALMRMVLTEWLKRELER